MKPWSRKQQYIGLSLALVLAIWGVYAQVHDFAFIRVDDGDYVVLNEHVNTGLTWTNIKWAFTQYHSSNWHPLTWISHMVDCQLFGLNPGPHHLVNVVFHTLNSILLFLILARWTGYLGRSALVAALFALHPTHVESVAWISERKDVLSTFFWMLAMGAYFHYSDRPGVKRYLSALLLFALGLMAKPMLVTFPCILILLDLWPLRRLDRTDPETPASEHFRKILRLLLEKVPYFALTLGSCLVTLYVQRGAVPSTERMPYALRFGNALLSFFRYIGKTIWPSGLSILYPRPHAMPPTGLIVLGLIALLALTITAVWIGRKYRFVPVGWFWYLITLLPVIGIVQVGSQSMADRYTYIPSVGLFILLAWGLPEGLPSNATVKRILWAGALLILVPLTWATGQQVSLWQESLPLYKHSCRVTENNYLLYKTTASLFHARGDIAEAVAHYEGALQCHFTQYEDTNLEILNQLGWLLATAEDETIRDPNRALDYARQANELTNHRHPVVLDTLAAAYAASGDFTRAAELMSQVLDMTPPAERDEYRQRLRLYRQGQAYTEVPEIDEESMRQYGESLPTPAQ